MLIFLYGKDSFQSKQKLSAIKNKFIAQDSSGSGLSVLDYDERISDSALQTALTEGGLFASKRLVLVINAITATTTDQQKSILSILQQKASLKTDTDLTVVFWEADEPKKNNALFKFLETNSKKQAFAQLDENACRKWILEFIASLSPKTTIENNAVSLLMTFVGNDLNALSNELTKLVNFREGAIIRNEDVEALVHSKESNSIFTVIEAIGQANKSRALELLHTQLSQGEDPFYILTMYIYQVRNLMKIAEEFEKGNRNHFTIAKAVGLHPFVAQKAMGQLKNLPLEKLKKMFRELAEIDVAIKIGKTDIVLALDQFIAKI